MREREYLLPIIGAMPILEKKHLLSAIMIVVQNYDDS
jgi:hypothetical protein